MMKNGPRKIRRKWQQYWIEKMGGAPPFFPTMAIGNGVSFTVKNCLSESDEK